MGTQDSRTEDQYTIFKFKEHLLDYIPQTAQASLAAAASETRSKGQAAAKQRTATFDDGQPHARVWLRQDLQQLGVRGNGLQRHHSIRHVLQPHRQRRIEIACTS